jgi:predicted ATPase/class 3 adenylate cyclase
LLLVSSVSGLRSQHRSRGFKSHHLHGRCRFDNAADHPFRLMGYCALGFGCEGARVAELPAGTATFLFTDLEGSTRLWQEHPDGMRAALARHDEIVRDAIVAHEGHLVKSTGDGFFAAFATASDSVDAAVAAQVALAAESWTLPDPLRVRIGIHTGPAEVRDDDYYGTTVNRAARIMSVAHGGQVVLSSSTQELLREAPIETVDLGEHRLKDLGQPERIFQVVHPDLEREFLPLQSLDTFSTNLPTLRTSFVGRDAEVAASKAALTDARLVTLTGVGGVGKTRLAVQVAADVISEFPDGVWLVELAAVGDPAAVPDAVATTIGLVPRAGITMTASIAEALAGRCSLLVLDNCEHVLDAVAELVEAIVARPGPLKVLATSREGLRLADERLLPVPSLGGRHGGGDDATALFVDRALAVVPHFEVDTPGTADAVEEICRRLDGIPLAIELAAARTIAMSVPELRDRLDDRFRLLSGSRRGLERHQTLRHAVQWSYDLLDVDERALLDRCSVFAGGFDLAAATAVGGAGALDEYAVLDLLEALVRKSLVTADPSSGRTRYSMLETIRQFAEEQLAATDDVTEVRARHARYWANRADEVVTWMGTPRDLDALEWTRLEFANLRAAFRTAADARDLDTAAPIAIAATALGFSLEWREAVAWAEELIEAASAVDHPRLAALCAAAAVCAAGARLEDGVRYADRARTLFDDPRYDKLPFGLGATLVAYAYNSIGRSDAWADFYRAEVGWSVDGRDDWKATLLYASFFSGRTDEAIALAGDAVASAEASGSPIQLSSALGAYGMAFFDRDPPAALTALRRNDTLSREIGINPGSSASLLARAEAAHGSPSAALETCERSLRAYARAGDRVGATTSLSVLASLLHRVGHDEPAAVIAGAGASAAVAAFPEITAVIQELRDILGADTFDSLADRCRAMGTTEMFRYALEQVEAARAAM